MYRLVEELRAEDTVAYKEMMRMNYETFSEIFTFSLSASLSSEYSSKLLFCCSSQDDGKYCIEPALVTPADRKTIMHYHPLGQTEKTIMNYHVEFEHVQTA